MQAKRSSAVVLCAFLLLTACGREAVTLPSGVHSLHGKVEAAELSFDRRGTHVLTRDSGTIAYLESKTLDLRRFEGQEVTVQGMWEFNIDHSDLPVLVVTELTGGSGSSSSKRSPGSASRSSVQSPATGTGGAICGGTAGILCPQGFYCDIFDLDANIGRCRSRR